MSSDNLHIEVAYALPERQALIDIQVKPGTTVAEAANQSGICQQFPEIDLDNAHFGIWNRAVKASQELKDGDRIEIYRPLIADPKEVRKRRAEKAIQEGRADKVTGGRVNPLKAENK